MPTLACPVVASFLDQMFGAAGAGQNDTLFGIRAFNQDIADAVVELAAERVWQVADPNDPTVQRRVGKVLRMARQELHRAFDAVSVALPHGYLGSRTWKACVNAVGVEALTAPLPPTLEFDQFDNELQATLEECLIDTTEIALLGQDGGLVKLKQRQTERATAVALAYRSLQAAVMTYLRPLQGSVDALPARNVGKQFYLFTCAAYKTADEQLELIKRLR